MDFANNPSFIRQGPSPAARLALCAALSVTLLISDSQFGLMEQVRQGLSVAFYPLQRAVNMPVTAARAVSDFFTTQASLQADNNALRNRHLAMAARLQRLETLEHDYETLRQLNHLKSARRDAGELAEVLYTGRDPFSYKIIIDKGEDAKLRPGQPVVDEQGLIGQVTRVQPLTAEVTLVVDKTLMIPVMLQRTGARAILYGYGGGVDVRYLPVHADVQSGDLFVTSGIDGLYPEGIPVARISRVDRNGDTAFIRLAAVPVAGVQRGRYVMVLDEKAHVPARPAEPPPPAPKAKKKSAEDEDN
ncbi:rod shape-determining protein MreC [Paludibacterium paludis]|nr:rod shape-determining protein MreC [Paludibacterium paludis]